MMAQIGEVLATYWRRAFFDRLAMFPFAALAVGVVAVSIVAVGNLVDPVPATRPTEAMFVELTIQLSMAACAALVGPFLIALHFKQQIIQIRQRRIPNAVAAHVIVAVGFLVLIAVVLPAAIMALGTWSWGTLGFIVALTAVTFAFYTIQMTLALILVPTLILILCFSWGRQWLEELWQGRHEAIGLVLLAAGICGIAATLVRLLQLSEEDAGYLDLSDPKTYSRCGPIANRPQTQAVSWLWKLRTPSEQQVQLWPEWARGSRWQRFKLWNAGSTVDFPLWLLTGFFLVLFSGEYIVSPVQRSNIMISSALFMTFYPIFTAVVTPWQQRKFAATESLRPVGRSQYLIETGQLYAYRLAVAWVQFSIAWCVPAIVFGSHVPVWGQQMFNLLALSAVCQVFLFGLSVWVMPYIGPVITWFALLAFSLTVPFLPWFARTDLRDASLGELLWVAPAIFVAGALLTWDAHRRWMRTELG